MGRIGGMCQSHRRSDLPRLMFPEPDPFAPSAYTAQLLDVARRHARHARPAQVFEVGLGSGVVLAGLLQAGAGRGGGVDIEPAAVDATRRLLLAEGLADRAEVRVGELWSTSGAQRYDLVVANLPHFAAERADDGVHLPSWGSGGADGRRWVDPFLTGLPRHLAPGGLALMTHNGFIDLERTQALVQALGLAARVVRPASAVVSPVKVAGMTPAVRARHQGRTIHVVGAYAFVDFDIVAIEWASGRGPGDG